MALTLDIRASIQTPATKRDYNQALFTRVATEYDAATRAMSLGRDQIWKRRLVATLPTAAAPRCIDLACGTGDVVGELARRFPAAQILGIDLTPAMVEIARARHGATRRDFVVADMCQLPVGEGWADVVTGSYALRNAPVLDDALREVRRVLRPGGTAAFLDFVKSPHRLLQAVQLPLLKAWGGMWGLLLHDGPEHAYIAESLRQFPDQRALRDRFTQHGFHLRTSRRCLGGLLEIVVIERA